MALDSSGFRSAIEQLDAQIRAAEKFLKSTPGATLEGVNASLLKFFDGRIRYDGNMPLSELPVNERLDAAIHVPELIRKAKAAEPELIRRTNAATEAIEKAIAEAQEDN